MITPSLILNFTSATLDPRITFARANATATKVNSSGFIESVAADSPRFDFNPVTKICTGLLIEESKTNNQINSEDFSLWTRLNTVVDVDNLLSPSNIQNADKIADDATSGIHRVAGVTAISFTSGSIYTLSVFAKAGTATVVQLTVSSGAVIGTGRANFNLATGELGLVSGGNATITDFDDGWYRCTFTFTSAGTTTAQSTVVLTNNDLNASRNVSYSGSSQYLYAWGAQHEAGAFATSYIPTTTTAVTRNADVATITGTNFSDFWQASKGGAQVLALPSTISGIRPLVQYDDGTADNIIALRGNAANPELQIVDGGAPQVQLDAGTIVANTPYSLTGWWQTNDCKARQNSGATVSDYTATIPTVTQARLGSDGTNYLNGHLATVNYYTSFFGQSIYTRRKNKVFASLL